MHILAFENHPTRFAGGQERSLFEACKGLAAVDGISVSLAYQQDGDLLDEYRSFCQGTVQVKSRVFRPSKVLSFGADALRIRSWIKKHGVTLLYANQYFDLPFVTAVGLMTGIPVVCHLRLPCPDYFSRQYKWALENATMGIAISNHTRQTYIDGGIDASKLAVIPNAIDTQFFKPPIPAPKRPRRLLYLGRLTPPKGPELLIDAFKLCREVEPDLELNIAGNVRGAEVDDSYLEVLKQKAGDFLDNGITFTPHAGDIRPLLNESRLLVMPSIWPEPFGRVLIEAMASGLPVVATRVGGVPEILSEKFPGSLADPDAEDLSKTILNVLGWQEEFPGLATSMRKHVIANYSMENYTPNLADALKRAAGVTDG